MVQWLTPIVPPPPTAEGHAIRLEDARPLVLTKSQLDALEVPPGSQLYLFLANRPFVVVTDDELQDEPVGGSYGPDGVEVDTGATWLDGKKVYRLTVAFGNLTPGDTGAPVVSGILADAFVHWEGVVKLSDGTWVFVGSSGFRATVDSVGAARLYGPVGETIDSGHLTFWYTR
jgi:hypothetical protein